MAFLFLTHLIFFWSSVFYTTLFENDKKSLTKKKMLPLVLFNQGIVLIPCLYDSILSTSSEPFPKHILKFIALILIMNLFFSIFHYTCHVNKFFIDIFIIYIIH